MRSTRMVAAAVAVLLATVGTACSDADPESASADRPEGKPSALQKVIDAKAKGPAPKVAGAKFGGTITAYRETPPSTLNPTNISSPDGLQITRLYLRTLTQFDIRDGRPVLVPDLAEDLGTESEDGLTWTFKLKKGITYHDGSPVTSKHFAYAIKRSFAHDLYREGPTYQLDYFRDGDKYHGPYGPGGETYSGVETPDDHTLVIHLRQKFADLPFFVAYPMFTPIPPAKDNRQNYEIEPMSTGPYKVDYHRPGFELKLVRNDNWNPNTDPVRHRFADKWVFKWGGDTVTQQKSVLASNYPDQNALHYGAVESGVLSQINQSNDSQLIRGQAPCTEMITMDSRRIPIEVRKAIAVAYPYSELRKAAGLTRLGEPPASTILPPAVPGYQNFELPGLTGAGTGDTAKAKQMLADAGRENFLLSWYFANDDRIAAEVSRKRAQALSAAGFEVKPVGVPKTRLRDLAGDPNAPVNMLKSPTTWCSAWPAGSSWFPELFTSRAIAQQHSAGQLESKELDEEIARISGLSAAEQFEEWPRLDRKILKDYLPVLPYYYDNAAFLVGENIGHAVNDPTKGLPDFTSMHLRQP
jgi:peptide/nickel transport system substrate-binding protein